MNNKIARRLALYSAFVLLLFALLSGVLFSLMFERHTVDVTRRDMQAHTTAIAETLSHFIANYHEGNCQGGGFKSYTRFVGRLSMSDLYLLDRQGESVTIGELQLPENAVPQGAKALADRVFDENTLLSEPVFGGLLHADSLMTAAPVTGADGHTLYALVLYYPVNHVEHTLRDTVYILSICLATAMALAIVVSLVLSRRFVRPLYHMMDTAIRLTDGDYSAKTEVFQNDEIGVLAGRIDALAERLQEAEKERSRFDQLQRDFFSDISHELRTPLSVLKGSVELLRDGTIDTPEQRRQYYEQLYADASHLERLVGDLLELNRLQNTQFSMEMDVVNIADIMADTVRSMRQKAKEKQIEIRLDNQAGAFPVLGDYARLRQLLIILLDNAVKFSPEHAAVCLAARRVGDGCEVSVEDRGSGMDAETLRHVFDRYYHKRSAGNRGGTGLGLPIAVEIARRHQMELVCRSESGKGTRFSMVFPEHEIPEE